MLKDNFSFIDNSYTHQSAIEKAFSNKLKAFLIGKFEHNTKDYHISYTRQGDTGNCWILSGITALSYTEEGREIIKKSLEYKKGYAIVHTICGNYVVLDSEINLTKLNSQYSDGDDDMIIFELAIEKILDDYANKITKISRVTNYLVKKTLKSTSTKIGNSSTSLGFPGACFYFLTGIEPVYIMTKVKMLEYLENLKEDKGKSLVLCASSHAKFRKRVKDIKDNNVPLYPCHCYAIEKFDGTNITVTNPHDTSKKIVLSKEMFFRLFSNIQACDLSKKENKREYFKPKIYYNQFGKVDKTIEINEEGYHIQYDYFYNKNGKPIKAECNAYKNNGIYTYCSLNFSKKEKYIENGNKNTKIALIRQYKNNNLKEIRFGKIEGKNKPSLITKTIGKQIKEYALYQYENIDEEKILLIAKDISNNNFSSAFKYCT